MHTQEFIYEMKTKLEAERAALTGELSKEGHTHDGSYETNFPDYGRSEEENADEVADRQARSAATANAKVRLEEVEAALARIESNTYGVTEDGKEIPSERLRANPAATTTIS